MTVQWNDASVKDRLLLAVIATMDKIDTREIARIYGNGMTYDALENRLRKIKKEAKALKDEAAHQTIATAATRNRTSKKADSKKDSVKTGRVTKTQKDNKGIKLEHSDEDLFAIALEQQCDKDGGVEGEEVEAEVLEI